jgi:hypothetical protein
MGTSEPFLHSLLDLIVRYGDQAMDYLTKVGKDTEKAQLKADPMTAILIAIGLTFWLGSAFWAASIASCRRHASLPHFLMGLILPWIWPLYILFNMEIKGERERKELAAQEAAKREAEEAEKARQLEAVIKEQRGLIRDDGVKGGYTRDYFLAISRKEDGTPGGPWKAVFFDREVLVKQILEVLDEVISVEMVDRKGKMSKMRMPFNKIESWEDTDQQELDKVLADAQAAEEAESSHKRKTTLKL